MAEPTTLELFRDWVWAPTCALIAWAWKHNDGEHKMLWKKHDAIRKDLSEGHSVLNNRIMEALDTRVNDAKAESDKRYDRMADHITKLFENAERDRAAFRDALFEHSRRSEERHIEVLQTLHTGLAGKADK